MIPSLTKAVKPLTTIQYIYIVQEQYNCLLRGGNRGGETIRNTAEKMVRPGEIIADIHPQEPEAAELFHFRSVNVYGCMLHLLPPPQVHNHLLSFADVESEVIILTPCCQGINLPSVD